MREQIRVVIVDDHSIFRSGLRSDLDDTVVIAGEASDVPSAIAVITEACPDVVLLDVHLPGGSGQDATGGEEVIRGCAGTPTRFLALSVSDAAEDVVRVIRAGARGYITKGSSGIEVSRAAHAVAGETAAVDDELDRLSAREQEVMRLIARGFAYKEVAAELFISVKTVETHVSAVLRKLQLSSRHELTAWASERRLL